MVSQPPISFLSQQTRGKNVGPSTLTTHEPPIILEVPTHFNQARKKISRLESLRLTTRSLQNQGRRSLVHYPQLEVFALPVAVSNDGYPLRYQGAPTTKFGFGSQDPSSILTPIMSLGSI